MPTIIVPTYNEADNLPELARQVHTAMGDTPYEVLVVDDDSPDSTMAVAGELGQSYPWRAICRTTPPRDLSLSVVAGIREARYDELVVMDADLSHPPDIIGQLLAVLADDETVFVLGSRYVEGGRFDRNWTILRFFNSNAATALARPLVSCADPMSGFMAFSARHVGDLDGLRPIGYKIGLELMVRGQFSRVVEVPIGFRDRVRGESKMNTTQQLNYLRHLRRLYMYKFGGFAEFLHFGVVGASGFVVDLTAYYLLQTVVPHEVARGLSFWPAVSWNWIMNRTTTFGARSRRPRIRQWVEFVLTSLVGFGFSFGTYVGLTSSVDFFAEYRLLAFVAGVGLASIFNFVASSLFVYSEKRT